MRRFLFISIFLIFSVNFFSQEFQWAKNIGGKIGMQPHRVTSDEVGNVYTIGIFSDTMDFDPSSAVFQMIPKGNTDAFLTKFDRHGNFVWAKQFGGSSLVWGSDVSTKNGNIYLTGHFEQTADFDPGSGLFNLTAINWDDIYICKLDTSGNFVWARSIGGRWDDKGNDIEIDQAGDIIVTGTFNDSVDFDPGIGINTLYSFGSRDIFILKLNASGNFVWVQQIGGKDSDMPNYLAVDGNTIFLTGRFSDTADFDPGVGALNLISNGQSDVFLLKLNLNGTLDFAKSFGSIYGDWGTSIAVDNSGNIIVGGNFTFTTDFDPGVGNFNITPAGLQDVFISKFDASGSFVWAKSFGTTSNEFISSVKIDNGNSILCSGYFRNTVDFDPGTGVFNLSTGPTNNKSYWLKLDAAGDFLWAKSIGNSSSTYLEHMALDDSRNIISIGRFNGILDADPDTGTYNIDGANNYSTFVHKMSQSLIVFDTACYSFNSPAGNTWTTSGTYYDSLLNANGLDSIIEYQLIINHSTYDTISFIGCDSVISFGGKVFKISGTYYDTLTNFNGCDSILVYDIIINYSSISQIQKLVSSDRGSIDLFGNSVSISGDYVIIGANGEDQDTNGLNALSDPGSAYVFERNSNGIWIEKQKLVASDRGANDGFGFSVSISGNYALVSAHLEDEDTSGLNSLTDAGSAYVFERNSSGIWEEKQKLVASDRGANDRFGFSVSISGNFLVIGADQEDEDTLGVNTLSDAGSAYVFERDASGIWHEKQKLVNSDRAANDLFGTSVSISGQTLVIGAHNESENEMGTVTMAGAGSIYVFNRNTGGIWTENQKLVASDRAPGSSLGISVSISNNYIVSGAYGEIKDAAGANNLTGAGAAYIFEKNSTGIWSETQKLVPSDRNYSDFFGYSVSISGKNILIGSRFEDEDASGMNSISAAGSAYVFERISSGVWSEKQKLVASDRATNDNFGNSVSISGNAIVIGAYFEDEDTFGLNTLNLSGSAYLFELNYSVSSMDSLIVNGCDSFISPSGKIWASSGVYYDTIVNSSGCDSIIRYDLTINNSFDTLISYSDCDSVLLPNGNVVRSSGLYYDSLLTSKGCDSIYVYSVTINNSIGANLNLDWAKLMGGSGNNEQADAVTTDVFGNVFSTGYFHGTVDFDPGVGTFNLTANGANYDIFISKLDRNGDFLWAKQLDGIGEDKAFSVTTDNTGAVYITGSFRNTLDFDPGVGVNNVTAVATNDAFILKLDAAGNFAWVNHYGASNGQIGLSVATDDNNNLYATGYFYSTIDFDVGTGTFNMSSVGLFDIYFLKLNSSGNFVWAKQIGGSNYEQAWNIHTDNSSVYLTGNFQGTTDFDPGVGTANLTAAGSVDAFVARYDANGNYIWARKFEGTGVEQGKWVTTDNAGNVYSTGEIMATTDFDPSASVANLTSNGNADVYLSKLDSNGNYVWAKSFGSALGDFSASVHTDNFGDVYLINTFRATVDYDPSGGVSNLISKGQYDIAIGKYSSAGNLIWAEGIGGTASEVVNSGHLDPSGTIYFAGYSTGTSDYDPSRDSLILSTTGLRDILVAKYNQITIINDTVCDQYVSASGKIFTSTGVYYDSINNSAGCDSIIEYDLVINYSFIDSITDTVCDSTVWRGMSLTSSGVYSDTVTTSCDSVFILNLHVDSTTRITIDTNLCPGDTLTLLNGNKVFATGTYYDTIATNAGNRVTNNVLFYENFEGGSHQFTLNTNDLLSITPGTNDNAWIVNNSYQGGSFLMLGVLPVTVPNTPNQNALVTGDTNSKYLHIYSKLAAASSASITNCNYIDSSLGTLSIGQNGMNFSKITSDVSTLGRTNVSFNFYYLCGGSWGRIYYSINGGVSWVPAGTFNSSTWTSFTSSNSVYDNQATLRFGVAFDNRDGITTDPAYGVDEISIRSIDTVPNISCDSIITYNVIALPVNDTILFDTICANEVYVLPNGGVHNGSGTYKDTITASTGCDSIRVLNLIVNDTSSSIQTLIACDSLISPSGKIWKTSGVYNDTIPNSVGCDSLMTFNLTISSVYRDTLIVSGCDTSITWRGTLYSNTIMISDTSTAGSCDSIFTLDLTVISSITLTRNDTACDSIQLPNGTFVNSSGTYRDTFARSNGCDSIIVSEVIVNQPTSSSQTLSACDSLISPSGKIWRTSGTYNDTISNSAGCDSLMTFNLIVSSEYRDTLVVSGCDTSVTWRGTLYSATIIISDTSTAGSCDSIFTLDLTVIPSITLTRSDTACDSIQLPSGVFVNSSGTYRDTFVRSNGCDSIIVSEVIVNQPSTFLLTQVVCDSFVSPSGKIWKFDGVYYDTIPNSAGCDSLMTFNITISSIYRDTLVIIHCDSPTGFRGWVYFTDTIVNDTVTSGFCDSIFTLDFTNYPVYNIQVYDTACDSVLLPTGNWVDSSGFYLDSNTSVNGCDSIYVYNIIINNSISVTQSIIVCDSMISPSGKIWRTSGTYFDTISSSKGCDSLMTFNLTVSSEYRDTLIVSGCDTSVTWRGTLYLNTIIISDTSTSGSCDSIFTLNLTVIPSITLTRNDTACDSVQLPSGVFVNSSGTYRDTFARSNGCDSIIISNVIVNQPTSSTQTLSACDSLISPSGKIWRTSGIYNDTVPNSAGCDSLMTFNLTIGGETSSSISPSACRSYISPSGKVYMFSGTYSDTIPNSVGCDSIIAINLTLISDTTITMLANDCDSYTLPGGVVVTSSGTYRDTLTGSNGCDSIIVTNLALGQSYANSQTLSICNGETVAVGGSVYGVTGVYQDTFFTALGCDSIITTNLTVNPSTPASITFTTNMCENANPVTFTSSPAGGTWSGGGIDAATGLFDPSVSGAGTFRIYYKAPGLCGETDSVDITVFSTPTIIGTVVDDQCDAGQGAIGIVLGGGTGQISYSWSTGDTTSSLQDLKEGTYSLRVVDANGCSDQATFEVVNLSSDTCEYHVYLPNIFSPDGNGQNDVFRVEGDGIEKLEFKIFNRWGNLIFESTDQTNGWDGTYKGQQVNQGVFVYQVVGNFVDGKKFSEKGTVTLVRR